MGLNFQYTKAVKAISLHFKAWKHSHTPQSRASFVQVHNLCSKTINNAKTSFVNYLSNEIASCQTGSRSFWPLAKVVSQNFCHSSFPPLKNNSGSSSSTPSFKANLFASTFASNSNVDDQGCQPPFYPTPTIVMPPVKFSARKVRKVRLQLNIAITKNQSEFQKLYSMVTSLICSTDSWYENIDHKKLNLTIFLDLRKSFRRG